MIKLCKDDDLLTILKGTFRANPISIPEERIEPLKVLSLENKKLSYIGKIDNLFLGESELNVEILNSQMSNLSAKKSKSVETNLGLQVLDGFLEGFGIQGGKLKFAFEGVEKVSFSFKNVLRRYIDKGELFNALEERKFNLKNPINKFFLEEKATCIIIDSVITSNNFSIIVEKTNKKDFQLNIPDIHNAINFNNNLKINSNNSTELSISGKKPLAFAFTGFILKCDIDGSIYFDNEPDEMYLTKHPEEDIEDLPQKIDLLNGKFGLLNIE